MGSYVEVNDEGAAIAAASELSSIGGRLDDQSVPPQVEWGDDRFGRAMIQRYNHGDLPAKAMDEKHILGRRLTKLGDATTRAVNEITIQDALNTADLSRVQVPEV